MAIGSQTNGASGERYLRDLAAAIAASDLAQASEIGTAALAQGLQHPAFYNARGLWAQQQGNFEQALDNFLRARTFTPRDATLLSAIGMCFVKLNRIDEAIAVFDAAISLQPAWAQTHFRKGWAHEMGGNQIAARRCYERAIALQPNHAEALAALAVIAARKGEVAKARELANRALKADAGEPTAIIALAIADISERDYAAAEERLRAGLSSPRAAGHTRSVMLGFLGDALDGLDRTAEAFATYIERNEEARKQNEIRFPAERRSSRLVAELAAGFARTEPSAWQQHDHEPLAAQGPREHVFLLGFLRSGTTLLEQVLAANPDVESLEERETLADSARVYLSGADGLKRLATIGPEELRVARETYWSKVSGFGAEVRGKVFIDKQPLNTFNLPLISKLFPNAKIIFALRDPRDVVFSCIRRHFEINATTFEFLLPEDAAKFYAAVMELAQSYRRILPLDLIEHRYEDMIENFEDRTQAICDYLGLALNDAMRNFSQSAQGTDIRSPSAAQVRRPLYGEGVGQWRRYEKELAPIFPVLQPWIDAFGYSG